MSKFAVIGVVEVLRAKLNARGIDVALVCLGEIPAPVLEEEHLVGSRVNGLFRWIVEQKAVKVLKEVQ